MSARKRRPGEFEIRILPDGRVFIATPDDALLEAARKLNEGKADESCAEKEKTDERAEEHRAQ